MMDGERERERRLTSTQMPQSSNLRRGRLWETQPPSPPFRLKQHSIWPMRNSSGNPTNLNPVSPGAFFPNIWILIPPGTLPSETLDDLLLGSSPIGTGEKTQAQERRLTRGRASRLGLPSRPLTHAGYARSFCECALREAHAGHSVSRTRDGSLAVRCRGAVRRSSRGIAHERRYHSPCARGEHLQKPPPPCACPLSHRSRSGAIYLPSQNGAVLNVTGSACALPRRERERGRGNRAMPPASLAASCASRSACSAPPAMPHGDEDTSRSATGGKWRETETEAVNF